MADVSKTVEIIFGGKNQVSEVISGIERDFNKLDASVKKIADPLAGVGESILKLDAALLTMAVGGMAYAIKSAGDFGLSFAEITTLISDTGEPIKKFESDILSYSTGSVKSIDEINQAIYASVSAGVDWKNSIEFVTAAEKLSVAGKAELGATTKALISTLNAYGESTDQAGKYSDIMFTTVRLGQTTLEELSSQLAKVTGLAANSGVPFETLSAAIAALTVSGLGTEQSITGLKAALSNIIKPSGEAEKMAAALGIQFDASALKTKGFEGVLKDVWTATGGSTEKMAQLFGSVEALNAVLVLGSDKTGKFKEALNEMQNAAGATQIAYDKMANEMKNINQRLANSFEATMITIGKELLPEYGKFADALANVFKGIKVGVDNGTFDPLFNYLDATGKSIADWLNSIAKAFPEAFKGLDFSGLVESFKRFGDAIAELFTVDTGKPEDLAEAMQLVIDSVESLVDVTRGIGEAFAPFISATKSGIDAFNALDETTKALVGNVLGLSMAYKALGPAATAVMLLMSTDSKSAESSVSFFFSAFKTGVDAIKVGVASLGMVFASSILYIEEFLDALPGYDNTAGVARAQERVNLLGEALNDWNKDLETSSTKTWQMMTGTYVEAEKLKTAVNAIPTKVTTTALIMPNLDPVTTEEMRWKIAQAVSTGDVNKVKILVALNDADVADTKAKLAKEIPPKKEVLIETRADGVTLEKAYGLIIETFPDGSKRIVQAETTINEIALASTKKKIDDAVPPAKVMEIQAKIDEAKIKASADIVQKAIEWKAKLDIADVEANAKIIEAAFKSIDNTITSTGTTLSSLIGVWADVLGGQMGGTSFIEEQIRQENVRRDEALQMQKDLTAAEVDNLKARTAALTKGESIIKIEGAGLQPHLEAFMFEILAAIQVRANAEGQKFLVGI